MNNASLHNGADLIVSNHIAVKFPGVVNKVFVKPLPAPSARLAVALVHVKASIDLRALFGDTRFDAIHVEVDVYTVGDRLLVVVLHDEIAVEVADGLLRGCRRPTADEGVKVVEHLPPEVVDRPVALVGDDEIESLDGDRRVVFDRDRLFGERRAGVERRAFLQLRV